MTKWVYLWSIKRDNREGEIYSEVVGKGELWLGEQVNYRVILKQYGNEVSDIICDELDQCREAAEDFVTYDLVWESEHES